MSFWLILHEFQLSVKTPIALFVFNVQTFVSYSLFGIELKSIYDEDLLGLQNVYNTVLETKYPPCQNDPQTETT